MVPAAAVDKVLDDLTSLLEPGDIVVDGGNSYYHDDIRRAAALKEKRIQYVDVGVSGGVWGLERGYCMMIGGEAEAVQRLDPIFKALAPGVARGPAHPWPHRRADPAENGYLHCGPNGGGHFVKMVHNGIEYGIMAAFAEGLNIIKNADAGKHQQEVDAETTPLRHPELYQYEFNLPDVAEVWRRGSVIGAWLLDLTASALHKNPDLPSSPAGCPIRAKGAGPCRPRLTKVFPPLLSARRSSAASVPGAWMILPTNSYRPCALSSAATWKRPRARQEVADGNSTCGCTGLFRRHR